MAAPHSSKMAATGRARKKQPSDSSTVSGKRAPAKEISVPYKAAPDFRYVPATGSLVRASSDGATITFVLDDVRAVSQAGTLVEQSDIHATYKAGRLVEENFRLMQVGIMIPLGEALKLALLLVQKVSEAKPELVENQAELLKTLKDKK